MGGKLSERHCSSSVILSALQGVSGGGGMRLACNTAMMCSIFVADIGGRGQIDDVHAGGTHVADIDRS